MSCLSKEDVKKRSNGTESACLPTNLHPTIQHAPQPFQPVYSASHPTPMDQDMPYSGPTVWPELQLSRSVQLISHPSLIGRDSSQPSRSVHSTSHPDSRNNVKKIKVKAKEVLNLTDETVAQQHISLSIGKKWAANKINMWNIVDDPLKRKAQIMDKVPNGIPPNQWISFIEYNFKESTKIAETAQCPGRAQMYIATHKNQDGVYVNEAAKEICEKIESALSQSTIDGSQVSPNDAIGKLGVATLGTDDHSRIQCCNQVYENSNSVPSILLQVFLFNTSNFLSCYNGRVSNKLGTSRPKAAKFSVVVLVITSNLIGVVFTVAVIATKNHYPRLFSAKPEVIHETSKLAYFLAATIFLMKIESILHVSLLLGACLGYIANIGVKGNLDWNAL
ncbi:hypothetical protein FXO38_14554 [Capsicum annuum]|nr:hypothetical protein FXO38_14554 [Capsicum annuum]